MRFFVDTSALVALVGFDDNNHESATEFREDLRREKTQVKLLITSNYVFDETMTLARARISHASAVSLGEALKSSKLFRIDWITPELDLAAWDIFVKYHDKGFSYTDCTSFALMKSRGITKVFGYDEHFGQFGFEQVPQ
ncbi:MAG: type II toxin-antitoxin system VapC family toxin [Nitrososphaerales archaeon]